MLVLLFLLTTSIPLAYSQKKPANGRVNENYVWLYDARGKLTKVFPLEKPVAENKNGAVNIAIKGPRNQLFEINGIKEKLLTDTVIKTASVRVVWITRSETYTSARYHKETTVFITCKDKKRGAPLRVRVITTLYAKNQPPYRMEASMNVTVPEKTYISN